MKRVNIFKNRVFIVSFVFLNILSIIMGLFVLTDFYRLFIGLLLFLLQLSISVRFGFIGAIISTIYNLIGSFFVYKAYLVNGDRLNVGVLLFLFSSIIGCFIVSRSVEKSRKYEKKLEKAIRVDLLTGAYNYMYMKDRLKRELSRALRSNESISMIMLGIDHFKHINELFGIKFGDFVMCELVDYLKFQLREYDTIYRYEGDTFCLLLPRTDIIQTKEIIDRMIKDLYILNGVGKIKNNGLTISLSFGFSTFPDLSDDMDHLIIQSTSALYNAKQSGRNQSKVYFDIFTHVKKHMEYDSDNFTESLKIVLWTLNSKDFYTYGHSERVSKYSVVIGEKLGLSDSEIHRLEIAALLHDIGKIGIPLEILNKKEKLTDSEYKLMQSHPSESRRILEPLAYIDDLLESIEAHHEFYNGNGYPHKLKGEDIPLFSRIICIADSFDAMRSDRPYRKGLSIDDSITEIKKNFGIQFDPKLAAIFIDDCIPKYSLI